MTVNGGEKRVMMARFDVTESDFECSWPAAANAHNSMVCVDVSHEGEAFLDGPRRPLIRLRMPAKVFRGSAAAAIWKMA